MFKILIMISLFNIMVLKNYKIKIIINLPKIQAKISLKLRVFYRKNCKYNILCILFIFIKFIFFYDDIISIT